MSINTDFSLITFTKTIENLYYQDKCKALARKKLLLKTIIEFYMSDDSENAETKSNFFPFYQNLAIIH